MKLKEKFNNEIISFENAAQKAAEKKAALAAEAADLEAKINTGYLYGVDEDIFTPGNGRPGTAALIAQLENIQERRAYPLIYDDQYRAAFIAYLETIQKDVTQEYYKLAADLHQAEAELKKQTQILTHKCAEAEQRLHDFNIEYHAITWAIHDAANGESNKPSRTADNIADPITANFNPAFNIEFNLKQLKEVSQRRELEKDPEYWKKQKAQAEALKEAENLRLKGLKRL